MNSIAKDIRLQELRFLKGFLSKKCTLYTSKCIVSQDVFLNSANPNQCRHTEGKTAVMKANHHFRALHHFKEKRKFPVNSSWYLKLSLVEILIRIWQNPQKRCLCVNEANLIIPKLLTLKMTTPRFTRPRVGFELNHSCSHFTLQ